MRYFLILCLLTVIAKPISSQTQDTVSVLTWNIFMLPRPFVFSNQTQRADTIVKKLNAENFDILVLQEVFDKKALRILRAGLAPKYPYVAGPGFKKFMQQTSGVMIFSKYPIYYDEFLPFKNCESIDCWAKKGALFTEILLPNKKKLQVIGTHMQSKRGVLYNYIRNQQLLSIYKMSDINREKDVPIIYAGDFNISEKDSLYCDMICMLRSSEMNIFSRRKHSFDEDNDLHSADDDIKRDWIDFILLDENQTDAKIIQSEIIRFEGMLKKNKKDLSDHYAVKSILVF